MEFNANYFVSKPVPLTVARVYARICLATDSTSLSDEQSYQRNDNLNHRFGFRWEYAIDSMNSILLTPNITYPAVRVRKF